MGRDSGGEGRPDDGRQSPVCTNTKGRDVAVVPVWRVDEPAPEVNRYGTGRAPPGGERRPGNRRQRTAFTDAVGRDAAELVCRVEEPAPEVNRQETGLCPGKGDPATGVRAPFSAMW
jgi:hypothetical protein